MRLVTITFRAHQDNPDSRSLPLIKSAKSPLPHEGTFTSSRDEDFTEGLRAWFFAHPGWEGLSVLLAQESYRWHKMLCHMTEIQKDNTPWSNSAVCDLVALCVSCLEKASHCQLAIPGKRCDWIFVRNDICNENESYSSRSGWTPLGGG